MIVLAQRWAEGTPSEKFDAQKVEALVWANDELWSCFYDPQKGETLQQAQGWWARGSMGITFGEAASIRAVEIVKGWGHAEEVVTIKEYAATTAAYCEQILRAVSAKADS